MKKLIIAFILLTGFSVNAQTVGNPNFENWTTPSTYTTDTLPLNWWSFYCNTVKPTMDAYSGTYATKIQGWFACGIAQGIMVNGTAPTMYGSFMDAGTPFTTKPAAISGYYKYTDVTAGDSAEVTIILKRYNTTTMQRDTVSYSTLALPATASYSLFTVPLNDLLPGVAPDSIIIMFNSSKHLLFDMTTMALPNLYIDRIVMPETTNNINENSTFLFASNLFPNPFSVSSTLVIDAEADQLKSAVVSIYDVNGKKVNEIRNLTSNTVQIEQNSLSAGNYFYKVTSEVGLLASGKFIVQ